MQGKSFTAARVDARQPQTPSRKPTSPRDRFPASDAAKPLGAVCFTALVSLMFPRPHSGHSLNGSAAAGAAGVNTQEAPAQARFAAILASRGGDPMAWEPSPPVDLDVLVAAVGRDVVGTFPALDMRKVDMRAYNAGRPVHDRRELILYRLLAPLPATAWSGSSSSSSSDDTSGGGGSGSSSIGGGANAHVLVHAYAADRNGLLTAANHLHGGMADRTASLSYSFVMHANADEAVMTTSASAGGDDRNGHGHGGWWLLEMSFPRAGAGRAVVTSKIWSPEGVHVATEYQDGVCTAPKGGTGGGKGRL